MSASEGLCSDYHRLFDDVAIETALSCDLTIFG